jgi:hypothetical protein
MAEIDTEAADESQRTASPERRAGGSFDPSEARVHSPIPERVTPVSRARRPRPPQMSAAEHIRLLREADRSIGSSAQRRRTARG